MIGELRAEAFLARVNRVSVLDFTGAEGNILPGDEIAGTSLASATDKWLVGGNIELLPVQKNVYVGVTPMLIFDNENSTALRYPDAKSGVQNHEKILLVNLKQIVSTTRDFVNHFLKIKKKN